MNEFKIGDRVRYHGQSNEAFSPWLIGFTGNIIAISTIDQSAQIRWDQDPGRGRANPSLGILLENIEPLPNPSPLHTAWSPE